MCVCVYVCVYDHSLCLSFIFLFTDLRKKRGWSATRFSARRGNTDLTRLTAAATFVEKSRCSPVTSEKQGQIISTPPPSSSSLLFDFVYIKKPSGSHTVTSAE